MNYPQTSSLGNRCDGNGGDKRSIALQLSEALRQDADGSQLIFAQVVDDQVQPPAQNDHVGGGEDEGELLRRGVGIVLGLGVRSQKGVKL